MILNLDSFFNVSIEKNMCDGENVKKKSLESDLYPNRSGFDFSHVDVEKLCLVFETEYVQQRLENLEQKCIENEFEIDEFVNDFQSLCIYISSNATEQKTRVKTRKDDRFSEGFQSNFWFDAD